MLICDERTTVVLDKVAHATQQNIQAVEAAVEAAFAVSNNSWSCLVCVGRVATSSGCECQGLHSDGHSIKLDDWTWRESYLDHRCSTDWRISIEDLVQRPFRFERHLG
jgi:hypothetical protein